MENGDVITIKGEGALQPIGAAADDQIEMIAAKVEKRMQALRTIVKACIMRTNPTDWVDQSGKPYLQASGAEKLRWPLGISWSFPKLPIPENHPSQFVYEEEFLRENLPDGHFTYTLKGLFSMGGVAIEAVGTRSSRDGFFKKYSGKGDNRIELPPSEIDHNDVKKSCLSNCIGNGITRLLGIRNMTWDELKEAGLDISKVAKIEYKTAEEDKGNKDLRDEIRLMALEMTSNDLKKAGDLIELHSSFVPRGKTEKERVKGLRQVSQLSEGRLAPTYGKLKEAYETWKKEAKPEDKKPGEVTESQLADFEAALKSADSIEELDSHIQAIVKCGVKGEAYTKLVRIRDARATDIKAGL